MIADGTTPYTGPAGIIFTHEELLIIWSHLTRIPNTENDEIRRRIKQYLEACEAQKTQKTQDAC